MTKRRGWGGWLAAFLAFLAVALAGGCGDDAPLPPASFALLADNACAVPLGQPAAFRVLAQAAPRRTALGGYVSAPAAGVRVVARPAVSGESAHAPAPDDALTGSDGMASVALPPFAAPGVYHYVLSLPDHPAIRPVDVYVYAGIVISGDAQDGWSGRLLHEPISIAAESAPGAPATGIELAFDARDVPAGTSLLASRLATGDDGQAHLSIKLGKEQGLGVLGMRVLSAPWKTAADVPDLKLTFFAVDIWNLVLGVAGGLAIFIFGMGLMSEGLTHIAGNRLRALLHSLTRNRWTAAMMGVAITGFIQSSSACSVMVIGFVNAGLMSLEQAIGVIIGANVGSTVTAQMLSFKLEALAYPAVALGVAYSLFAKKSRGRFVAQIMIGFGLLFLGMQLMAAPLGELRHSQFVRGAFSYLDCTPIHGWMPFGAVCKAIGVGMLMTMVMQSSAAFIGVLLALASAGLIDPYTSLAVLLGSNIGTTITAVLATIGSSVAAKRTACAHVIFNLAGTALIVATLYIPWHGRPTFMVLVDCVTPGDIFNGENVVRFLANAHTAFNVICAVFFLFLVGALARLTRLLIPEERRADDKPQPAPRLLDHHLVNVPALAITLAWREINVMLQKGGDALFPSLRAIFDCDGKDDHNFEKLTTDVKQLEADVDELQSSITSYVSSITVKSSMGESEGVALPNILHSVNDAERVSDHAMHLIRLAKRSHKHALKISPDAVKELDEMEAILRHLFVNCGRVIEEDPVPEYLVGESHDLVKHLHKVINDASKAHLERQESGVCDVRSGAIYQELLYNLHRVGSHLNNIIKAAGSNMGKQMSRLERPE